MEDISIGSTAEASIKGQPPCQLPRTGVVFPKDGPNETLPRLESLYNGEDAIMVFRVLAMSKTTPAYLDLSEIHASFDLSFPTLLQKTKPSYRLLSKKVRGGSLWPLDKFPSR